MSAIRTNAAAAMLGVSPNTLRSWERRFDYPRPRRSEGGHRQFELAEIEALRQAFEETQNISSAISVARERGPGMGSLDGLRGAFESFDGERADRLLEESLAVRSVERTVSATLLPAVSSLANAGIQSRAGQGGAGQGGVAPEYGFAWRHASGWLAATARVAPAATRSEGVVIFDASAPSALDALYVQALELFVRRIGMRVLTLPVDLQQARLAHALQALAPSAVVLAGSGASLDALGRLVYVARRSGGDFEVMDYRDALPDTGASTIVRLGKEPEAATATLHERVCLQRANAAPRKQRGPCAAVSLSE
jgi:hypothetical protein